MSGPWRITPYMKAEASDDSDAVRTWTEYSIDSDEGPICTGVMTRDIAEQIAVLGRVPDKERTERLLNAFGILPASPKPTTENLVDQMGTAMVELLAEVRHMRADLRDRTASISSVELAENAKGAVQLTVKCYADSPVDVAADEAIDEFGRLKRRIEAAQTIQWAETVERIREASGDK